MKHTIIYIIAALLSALTSGCSSQDDALRPQGSGVLSLQLHRVGCVAETRAVSNELAVTIVGADGPVATYAPGQVPDRIKLEPGSYELFAYTDNQETWEQDNEGRGSACHWGHAAFTITYDNVTYVNMQVPMTNYAVALSLPPLFEQLFVSHSLKLSCGGRTTSIRQGEKAYFDPAKGGFSYMLTATNNDQVTHSTATVMHREVESGKCYTLTYYYDTDSNSGGIDIEIKDDMDTEDVERPI
ncbi:MAG: DUF4493 domain-containing protein [Bacteroidaceae bacterium]